MEKKLPEGWKEYKIKDIGDVVTGSTPPKKDPENYGGVLPWIKPPDLDIDKFVSTSEETISETGRKKVRLLPKGSVLVSCIGNIGKVAIADTELCTNQQINSIIPDENIVVSDFLYYTIKKIRPYLENIASSAVVPLLNKTDFSNINIKLPPLETQKKIVSILEKAEETRKLRAQADELTQKLLQSVFLEMFGDPTENPNNWNLSEFKNISKEFRYGSSNKSLNIGYPILRIPNVVDGEINLKDLKYCELLDKEYEKLRLLKGDMLFVRTNGNQDYVGRCAIIEEQQENFVYASYLIRAKIDSKFVLPQYLKAFFSTSHGKSLIKAKTKTSAGQFNINTEGLGSLPVLIPPIKLQQKFVELVNKIEETKKSQKQSSLEINTLFDALMQKAFTGKLVS